MVDDGVDVIMEDLARWAKAASPAREGTDAESRLQLELLRDHLGVHELGELTTWGLRQLLLSVYPRKITVLDEHDLVDVLPTARDLVRFAEETGRMRAGAVAELRREIDEIEPQFEETVMDPGNWGMARSIMQKMVAAGVDPSDAEEIDQWLDAYNSSVDRSAPPGPEMRELASALGLPERLPPLRLPPEPELAHSARSNDLLRQAVRLSAWTGDHRETEDDELGPLDAVAAAEAVGIRLPSATSASEPDGVLPDMPAQPPVKAMRDVPELRQLWRLAVNAGLIEICAGHVHVDEDPAVLSEDDDALGAWTEAFGYVLSSWLPTEAETHHQRVLDFASAGLLVFTMLFLAREPLKVSELGKDVEEIVKAGSPPAKALKAWTSWTRRHGDPTGALLARLADLGAVIVRDGTAQLTPLGMFGARELLGEMGVDVPLLPPTDQMSAADLVDAAGMSEAEFDAETAAWLDLRDVQSAADELLAAAGAGSARVRLVATSIASGLGEAAEPRWRAALDRTELRPYAKIALARIAGLDSGEVLPGAEPEPSDAAWLLADTVMATADDGEDDAILEQFRHAVPSGQEAGMFEALWRLPHPDAPEVLTTLGRVHPDKKIAKLARKAAFKARSQAARMPPF